MRKGILRFFVLLIVLVPLSAAALIGSTALHNFLQYGASSLQLYPIKFCIDSIKVNEQHRLLFICLEGLVLLIGIFLATQSGRTYKTDVMEVTPDIHTPKPSGQGQHGTAMWMSIKEKRHIFSVVSFRKQNEVIRFLLREGKRDYIKAKRYKDPNQDEPVEEVVKEVIPKSTITLNADNPLINFFSKLFNKLFKPIALLKAKLDRLIQKGKKYLHQKKVRLCKRVRVTTRPFLNMTRKVRKRRTLLIGKLKKAFLKIKNVFTFFSHEVSEEVVQKKIEKPKPKVKEIKSACNIAPLYKQGGLVVGKEHLKKDSNIYVQTDDTHSIIIGATRCGKTRGLVVQSVVGLALAGESMVLSDPKGELFYYTSDFLKRLGYEVVPVDFENPNKSWRYNLLQPIIDAVKDGLIDKAQMYSWDLTNNIVHDNTKSEPIWSNGEKATIAMAILCVVCDNMDKPQFQNMTNVYYFIAEMCRMGGPKGDKMPLLDYVKTLEESHPAKALMRISDVAPSKTRSSFYTSALTSLQLFTSRDIYGMTKDSSFSLSAAGKKKQAIFFILPDQKTTYYPIVSLIVSQQYEQLVLLAKKNGNRLPKRVNFMLDEFGNFTKISDMDVKLTVGGGYGIRFNLFLQSFAQLDEKYGENIAKIIKGNCQTWVYLLSTDENTLKVIEGRLGTYTTSGYSLSAQHQRFSNPSSSHSFQLLQRNLLNADEIVRIRRPYQLVISPNNPAVMFAPDLSKWSINKMLGLGSKKHNIKVIKQKESERPIITDTNQQPKLWGIWNDPFSNVKKTPYKRGNKTQQEEYYDD